MRYRHAGRHLIAARYSGDADFTSSSSPAELVDGVKGRIHPTLSWSFYFAPRYTKVLELVVEHVPAGARVRVTCTGRGCPASRVVSGLASAQAGGGTDLTRLFRGRRLRPGTVILVSVRRRGWIGKRYAFHVRRAHPPRLSISCQAAGLPPGVGC